MKISGFTMAKNAAKLYYPIKAAIASILPIVDEFVVALGDNDEDDHSLEEIQSLSSDKIKIIRTTWDLEKYPRGMENAHQTDIAKEACKGDWLFYLQADEVVHEKYLPLIHKKCEERLSDKEVEGFLFKYKHFYGDYWHYNNRHGWYPREIRIIRNDPDIHSHVSAQSFRRIPNFDGVSYRQMKGTQLLQVEEIDAYIYHYGWVRPPQLMQKKNKSLSTIHHGAQASDKKFEAQQLYFDYGNMNLYPKFKGSHPKVMQEFIERFDWEDELHFEKGYRPQRPPMKHEKLKSKVLTFFEQRFTNGKPIFGYYNWKIVK